MAAKETRIIFYWSIPFLVTKCCPCFHPKLLFVRTMTTEDKGPLMALSLRFIVVVFLYLRRTVEDEEQIQIMR